MRVRLAAALAVTCALSSAVTLARAETPAERRAERREDKSHDGVYNRFDGDLELSLGVGAELGSAGNAASLLRAAAYYYSSGGLYVLGRVPLGGRSARDLFETGVEAKPLFLIRWKRALEQGPSLLDLTLDSCSLTLGAFWSSAAGGSFGGEHGFDAGFGLGVPLFAGAAGPWLEARGILRYPSELPREEAAYLLLAWHGFLQTPFVGD
ncbi:MAG TPA: hypothetical protein VGI10_12050 [Polyangiaceae bacterium]